MVDLPAVARRLGVNERHLRRLVSERRIPFLKWGRLLRFDSILCRRHRLGHRVDERSRRRR